MKKLLPQFCSKTAATFVAATNNSFTCKAQRLFLLSVFTLSLTAVFSQQSHAQTMYYLGSDGSLTNNAGDGIYKVNQDGTGLTRVCNGVSAPQDMTLDIPNNRAFVTSFTPSGNTTATANGLYRIDLSTGTATKILATNDGFRVANLTYDPVNDWVYYTSNDGNGATTVANDGLYRIKPDGTSNTALATSISATPTFLGIDIPHNKIYIFESVVTAPKLMTYNLSGNSATLASSFVMPRINGMDYDPVNNWIYYTTDNGTTALTTDDALWKVHPDGTSSTKIISSLTANPNIVTVERTRNIAFVWNSTAGDRRIVKVDVAAGTQSAFPISPAFSISNQVAAIVIPAASKVATLSAFTISSGTLSPSFASGTTTYTASVANSVNSITVTPTKTDNFASIKVNGTTVTSGSASGNLALNIGDNVINTVVTAEDGLTTKTYALTVNRPKAAQTITFNAIAAKTYGNADFAAGASTSSGLTVGLSSSNTAVATISGSNIHIVGAGTATITASQAGDASYLAATNVAQTLTVSQASQTITFGATATKTFGDADFATGGSVNSNLTVSYASSNTAVATVSGSTIHIVGAGTANITASQSGDANRAAATSVVQALTVNKASQTITFGAIAAKTYGNADFAPGATVASGLNVTYASDNTSVATIVSNQVHIVGQGTANITASQGGNSNYNAAANVVQSLTVNKANLTITAAAKTKVYGDDDPAFTYTTTGLVGTDAATGALSRVSPTNNRNIGTYAIGQGTLAYGNNYNVTYVGANLTITKRPVTLLPAAKTKVYGDAEVFLNQYSFASGSIAPGDGSTSVFGRAAGESVGTYLMTLGTKKFIYSNEDVTANYDITIAPAYYTITAKPITVTATAQTKTYGDADPALTYSTDVSLVSGDSFSGALSRAAGEGFGTYAINKNTLALSSNYTLSYTSANLTIAKKTINVTADAKTKTYGDADPALTYTADALKSGDGFTGAITRAAGESFGTYAISQGTLALNSNYTLNFTGANFTINKKTINVTAAAKSKIYGDSDPALTYTADALISGDSFTGAINRAAGESAGTYAINQNTLALSSNYTLNYTGADFTIGKRAITISAYPPEVSYGNADATIGYSYSGTLASGDAVTGAPGRDAGTAVGSYAVNQGTLTVTHSESYDVTFYGGSYKIIPREIQVTGGSTIKIYGDADPAINYTIYAGTLLGGTQITGSVVRDAGETAGPYNVSQGTLAINDSNYKLTFLGGYFEIDRAPLTLTIDNKTKVATKPNPVLTYSVSGYKNGDTEATAFTSAIQLVTDANINSGAGTYNIYNNNGGLYNPNYNLTITGGTLTVTPASSINTLATATLNGGGFDGGAFDPATDFYSVSIPNGSTSATLILTVTDPLAHITIGYDPATAVEVASGAPYIVTFSNNNTEQVPVNVTAEDGTVRSYYFNINPIPSDSKLSNLDTNIGIIQPSFNPLVTSYTLDVSADTEFLTITPTTHDRLATARVSGGGEGGDEGVGGGTGAKTVAIREGGNPLSVIVKSADGTGTTFYQLYVKRPIRLASLTISDGQLFPAFDPNVDTYTAKVNSAVPSITVSPKGNQPYFNTFVNGDYVNYGDASAPVTINEDGSTTITVKIVAGDGETSKAYTINVVHASNDATLAGISTSTGSLDPAFDPATLTYNVYLPNSATAFSFTPATTDANAAVTVNNAPLAHGDAITESNLAVGLHNYYIVVTAADGVSAKNYLLSVSRPPSGEPGLSNILASAGTLSPAFDPTASPNYDIAAPAGVESITITPVLIDTTAILQARLNGHNLAVGDSRVLTVPLTALYNTLVITSTAQDGTTQAIYTITITRPQSADNTLSALTASIGTFRQSFSSSRTFYQIVVPSDATNIILSPFATSNFATIKVDGVPVARGMSSQSLQLNSPVKFFPIQVTAEDGSVNTISVLVAKASKNANLYSLTTNKGVLNPVFDKDVLNYSMAVSGTVSSLQVTAGIADTTARIKINGAPAQSFSPVTIPLALGSNLVSVVVTPQEGADKTYTINVTRVYGTNASLATLTVDQGALSPAFSGAVTSYNVAVASTVSTVQIHPAVSDANAKISVGDSVYTSGTPIINYPLVTGTNTLVVKVTADDGTTIKNYTLNIKRAASPIANLSQLYLTAPSVAKTNAATGPGDYNYTASVTASTHTIRVVAAATDAGATIKVNGVITASGATSAPIVLGADSTFITVQVTAANNFTVKNYVIKVLRPVSAVATLGQLYLTAPSIAKTSVNSGTGDFNYTASVPGSISNIKVVAVASDSSATIRVNGVITASGAISAPVTLNTDSTLITVQVTAANNTTIKTYVIKVSKEAVSSLATLSKLYLVSPAVAKTNVSTGPAEYNSTANVSATTKTIKVVAVATDTTAIIRINGVITASGASSAPVTLAVGENVINIVVTAQNGTTTHSWAITVTKPAPPIIAAAMPNRNQIDMVQKPDQTVTESLPEAILVKQAVSPNGDGINDRFTIEGINAFPENKVQVMNRNGDVVYEAKGYDNQSTAFDGRSSKGTLQQPGTYFYSIEYKKGAETLRKTGYLVLKY